MSQKPSNNELAAKEQAEKDAAAKEQAAKEQAEKDAAAKDAPSKDNSKKRVLVIDKPREGEERYRCDGLNNSVRAFQVKEPFYIKTPDEAQEGEPGDWVVKLQDGSRHVVKDAEFKAKFKKCR